MERVAKRSGHEERRALVVVGAGAAGLFAATFAARSGADVLVLETSPKPGAKIRISGGGRCNLLPTVATLDDFWTNGSIAAVRNVVLSWPLAEVRAYFENDLGIALHDEPTGKVFPTNGSARAVAAALLADTERAGAEIRAGVRVRAIRRRESGTLAIETANDETIVARRIVLATGGLSLPKTGSDGAGLRFAEALGHSVRTTHPALVPLLTAGSGWSELAGVSLRVRARAVRAGAVLEERTGDFLFTHRGFSGPVVLDLSRRFAAPDGSGTELRVSWGAWSAGDWESELGSGGPRQVKTVIAQRIPERLAERVLRRAGVDPVARLATLRREERRRVLEELTDARLVVIGDEGYRVAEVTGGGIPLEEVRSRTLESRVCAGLHFAGEILDATGRLGGYNFLWAWVSGRVAGEGAARLVARDARGD